VVGVGERSAGGSEEEAAGHAESDDEGGAGVGADGDDFAFAEDVGDGGAAEEVVFGHAAAGGSGRVGC